MRLRGDSALTISGIENLNAAGSIPEGLEERQEKLEHLYLWDLLHQFLGHFEMLQSATA